MSMLLHTVLLLHCMGVRGLVVCGLNLPSARLSPASRALDEARPETFPYSATDLTPTSAGRDWAFYIIPKFVQHAGDESRAALTSFYEVALPSPGGAVLDLCSSWTSHYPKDVRLGRCTALGLNPVELAANPSKTDWVVHDLNSDPTLPFEDESFDCVTNALSVDYLTSPLEVFSDIARVLRPGGIACMAFTNRCFPGKVVPVWTRPFTEAHHAEIVGNCAACRPRTLCTHGTGSLPEYCDFAASPLSLSRVLRFSFLIAGMGGNWSC